MREPYLTGLISLTVDKAELFEFYRSLDLPYRILIEFRLKHKLGKSFEQIVAEEPWRLYPALADTLGLHNAEVFLAVLQDWLRRKGKAVDKETLRRWLSSRDVWFKKATKS